MIKLLILFIIVNLPPILCVYFAGELAIHDLKGWGWFLFVAFISFAYVRQKERG
jgi:hypothetical protein